MDDSLVITRFLFFYPKGPTFEGDNAWGYTQNTTSPGMYPMHATNNGPLLASQVPVDQFRFRNPGLDDEDVEEDVAMGEAD